MISSSIQMTQRTMPFQSQEGKGLWIKFHNNAGTVASRSVQEKNTNEYMETRTVNQRCIVVYCSLENTLSRSVYIARNKKASVSFGRNCKNV